MRYPAKLFITALFAISLFPAASLKAAPVSHTPILVIATDKNFGSFTAEILRTEGFNEFQKEPLTGKINLPYLKKFDIVILTEMLLTTTQQEMFSRYVQEGGNLIAFRPDKILDDIFGISYTGGTLNEAYISIDTGTSIGKGITQETLQLHTDADQCSIKTGKKIAVLSDRAGASTGYPAAVVHAYGKGQALAFLYNLPQNIVYTRQGNYRHAGQEMDGITGIRAMDLFTNGWVDTTKNVLNQADEQMRLLSHAIETMNGNSKPLPRFWYFPDTLKCLVTLNNDGEDSKEQEFTQQFEDVNARGAKMTLYVKEVDFISKPWITSWINKGFEISGHPDDTKQAVKPDWKTMDTVYEGITGRLKKAYGVGAMYTTTNHWFVWCGNNKDGSSDFAAQARIEEKHGIGLDCNYAHYDNNSNQQHFLGHVGSMQGNFNGSGLPLKFVDQPGTLVNIYQLLNNVYDQQYMEHKDSTGFYECFKGLMDRSINNEVYSYITIKAHNDEYFFSKTSLLRMLDYAKEKSIPVWTPARLLDFLKAKDDAMFSNIKWLNNKLSFEVKSAITGNSKLAIMIPWLYNGKIINEISIDGIKHPCLLKRVKGFDYAFLTIKPGSSYAIKVNYVN